MNLSIACSQLKFHRVYHKIWKTKILWLYIIIAFRLLIFVDRGVVRIRRVIIRAIFIIHMFGTFYIRLSFLKATVLVTGYSRKPGLKQTQCHWNLRGVSQTNKPTTTLWGRSYATQSYKLLKLSKSNNVFQSCLHSSTTFLNPVLINPRQVERFSPCIESPSRPK